MTRSDPRTGGSFSNAREAIQLYREAIERDPGFALAHVQIARAWTTQGYSNPDAASPEQIEAQSRSALTRALEIDPNLPEAHRLAAQLHSGDFEWEAAEREYRWAVQHEPDSAAAHASLGGFLGAMGRFDEALEHALLAERLRHSPADAFTVARIYYQMRRYDDAVEKCRQALSSQENQAFRFYLGMMLIARGRPEEGVAELERSTSQGDNAGTWLGLAYGYATLGRREDALKVVDRVRATHREDQVVAYRLAAVHVALGDHDSAMSELMRDRAARGGWMLQLKVDPVMDPLRSDRRFQELMRDMDFP